MTNSSPLAFRYTEPVLLTNGVISSSQSVVKDELTYSCLLNHSGLLKGQLLLLSQTQHDPLCFAGSQLALWQNHDLSKIGTPSQHTKIIQPRS
jgi:formylmethanofuran dehydrogenase subunit E-like metal-binding protein